MTRTCRYSASAMATFAAARSMTAGAEQVLLAWGLSPRRVAECKLAVAEMASNVSRHGYPDGPGPMRLVMTWDDGGLTISMRDQGRAFDPHAVAPPARPRPGDPSSWQESGLGVSILRAVSDRLDYRSDRDGNVLSVSISDPTA